MLRLGLSPIPDEGLLEMFLLVIPSEIGRLVHSLAKDLLVLISFRLQL